MAKSIQDLWQTYLQGEGYSGKSVNDLMVRALQDQTGTSIKNINRLWDKYLGDLGFTGALNDKFMAWLRDKGYSGGYNTMLQKALEASDIFWTSLLAGSTFTRASDATYWDSSSVLQTAAADEIRQDHAPATGAYRGVLVEQAATNLMVSSNDIFTNWTRRSNGQAVYTADATTAPDGTVTADKCEGVEGHGNDVYHTFTGLGANEKYEPSVFIKRISTSGTIHLLQPASPEYGRFSIDLSLLSDDWEHITENHPAATVVNVFTADPDGLSGHHYLSPTTGGVDFYLWGAQSETGDYNTSFIYTSGTAVTRPDEILTSTFSRSSGTLHLVGEHIGGDGVLWQSDNTTENSRMRIDVSSGNVRLVVDDGGVNQVTLTAGALASDGKYDLAFRFDTNDFAISLDGATAVTATSGTVPTVTTGRFGADTSGPTGRNWYKTSDYRASLLTDAQLEALTA